MDSNTSFHDFLSIEEQTFLAHFVNRLNYDDIARKAESDEEAALMVAALDALREYLEISAAGRWYCVNCQKAHSKYETCPVQVEPFKEFINLEPRGESF